MIRAIVGVERIANPNYPNVFHTGRAITEARPELDDRVHAVRVEAGNSADLYVAALRAGSLLNGNTQQPAYVPRDDDKFRLPEGHDRHIDGIPYDAEVDEVLQQQIKTFRTPQDK